MLEKPVHRATLTVQIEDALRQDIILGVLAPGQRLRAATLTQRYGVSATPLREALQRLAAENLVDIDSRLGATVSDVSTADLQDIYFVRDLLEGIALERSIANANEDWGRGVQETWEAFLHAAERRTDTTSRADVIAWSAAHRAFHEALFASCESPWLFRFVTTLSDHSERYRMLSVLSHTRDTVEEHRAIYDSSIARNAPVAVAALRRHLALTVDVVTDGLVLAQQAQGERILDSRP